MGFTLLELLVVIGILAALAITVVLIMNPSELLKETRDSTRMSDLQTVHSALTLYGIDQNSGFFGTSSIVYVSIPDATTTCANLGLPALPNGWSYNCATATNLRKTDGSGWIPVNFQSITYNSPLGRLPIDPVNTTTTGNYYTYVMGGSWELSTLLESTQYRMGGSDDRVSRDGGDSYGFFEMGNNLTLNPIKETNGLVGYWKFDEGTGTTATDKSGNGNNGTLYNGPIWTSGKIGGALSFDGTNDYVDLGSNSLINQTGNLTISAWFRANSNYAQNQAIVGNTNVSGSLTNYGVTFGYTNNKIEYWSNTNGPALTSNLSISDNNWRHIVTIRSGSPSVWNLKIYIDGVLDKSGTTNSNPPGGVLNTSIGRFGAYNSYYLNGLIDDVRIYNRALSAAEISAIYNATK